MDLHAYYLRKKFWIKDFFQGGHMWNAFKEIEFIYKNVDEGEKIRQRRLSELISFAKTNTKFYANIKGDKLSDFPVINKQIILNHRDCFLVPDNAIPGQKGPLHIQKTFFH